MSLVSTDKRVDSKETNVPFFKALLFERWKRALAFAYFTYIPCCAVVLMQHNTKISVTLLNALLLLDLIEYSPQQIE